MIDSSVRLINLKKMSSQNVKAFRLNFIHRVYGIIAALRSSLPFFFAVVFCFTLFGWFHFMAHQPL